MAKSKRVLDVWIVETNQVYREVPFTVVADWVQQGRLLADDRVRLAGNEKWHSLNEVPAFTPYLPHPEPVHTDDQAEALEAVDLGFDWRRSDEGEDDDVDMIPLIDISLVLLIFFMMTASLTNGTPSTIRTPSARHKTEMVGNDQYWLGIDVRNRGGVVEKAEGKVLPWYSLGKDTKEFEPPARDLSKILATLGKSLDTEVGEVRVRIRADQSLPIEIIKGATLDLQVLEQELNAKRAGRSKVVLTVLGEVSEPEGK